MASRIIDNRSLPESMTTSYLGATKYFGGLLAVISNLGQRGEACSRFLRVATGEEADIQGR